MTGRRHGPAGTDRGFGPGGWGGPPGFGGHRRRMRRGDVRAALLVLLAEEPQTGYGLMGEIEQRSGGAWRPSPGRCAGPATARGRGSRHERRGRGRQPYDCRRGPQLRRGTSRRAGRALGEAGRGIGEERMELRGLIGQLGAAAGPSRSCRRRRSGSPRKGVARGPVAAYTGSSPETTSGRSSSDQGPDERHAVIGGRPAGVHALLVRIEQA